MKGLTRVSIAVVCALGVSAALAQSVQRNGATVGKAGSAQTVAQASSAAPIQTAQAGSAAGGAAGGASSTGALGGVTAAGSTGGTLIFIGAAAVAVAGASQGNNTTVTH